MRLRGLDLNLLVAFDVLLQERNVSRAARRLNLSQSAASSALGRLRQFFNDDILVANGRRMYATPFADSLWPQVRECLGVAEGLTIASSRFDPGSSRRVFQIIASDYIMAAVFAPMMRLLAKSAPDISFAFVMPEHGATARFEEGALDLLIAPSQYIASGQPADVLFEESYVVVGCRDNPLFGGPITEEAVLACRHVGVAAGPRREPSFADRHLDILGKVRRIEVSASSFAQLPWLLVGTRRLSVMPRRLAITLAENFAIAHAPLPFDFPLMIEMMQYHETRRHDDGLQWLRAQLHAFTAQPVAA